MNQSEPTAEFPTTSESPWRGLETSRMAELTKPQSPRSQPQTIRFDDIENCSILEQRDPDECETGNPRDCSKINWEDYDWPFCCSLVHFNLTEIDKRIRWVFRLLYINFFTLMGVLLMKMVVYLFYLISPESSPQTYPMSHFVNKFIVVSVLSFILCILKIACFYSAYRGFFYESKFKVLYKVIQVAFIIFLFLNAIYNEFIFDGMILIVNNQKQKSKEGVYNFIHFMYCVEFSFTVLYLLISLVSFIGFLVIEARFDD